MVPRRKAACLQLLAIRGFRPVCDERRWIRGPPAHRLAPRRWCRRLAAERTDRLLALQRRRAAAALVHGQPRRDEASLLAVVLRRRRPARLGPAALTQSNQPVAAPRRRMGLHIEERGRRDPRGRVGRVGATLNPWLGSKAPRLLAAEGGRRQPAGAALRV